MDINLVDLTGAGPVGRARRRVVALGARILTWPAYSGVLSGPAVRFFEEAAGMLGQRFPKGVERRTAALDGVPCWLFEPAHAATDRAVFVVHGGGYRSGGLRSHGPSSAELARLIGAPVWMPDYRLTPEHPVTAPLEDVRRAWDALTEEVPAERVVMTGDSAGGGLALRLVATLRDDERPLPAAMCLMSAWVDARKATTDARWGDAILTPAGLRKDAAAWRGDDPEDDLRVSPLLCDMTGLPPTLLQWGHGEGLHADSVALAHRLSEAGVEVTAEAYDGLWHDAQVHIGALPESHRWLKRTADFLLANLG